MAVVQPPAEFEDLEFRVEEEHWNDYEFHGGYRMIARSILVKVMRRPGAEPGKLQMGTAAQDVFLLTAAPGPKGQPSPLTPEEISGQVPVSRVPLRIEKSNELWNRYEIPRTGDRLRTRLMVTDVFHVPNRFDKFGYPAVIIISGLMATFEKGAMQPRTT